MTEILARWRRRAAVLLGRRTQAREMDEEMRLHLEFETEDLVRSGVPISEARRRARLAFGGIERFREEGREARAGYRVERMLRDLRVVMRMLRRSRGFAAVVVLTVALGIGSTSAIYALVNRIVLQPLPFPAAERLVYITHDAVGLGLADAGVSTGSALHYRERANAFEALATYRETVLNLSTGEGSAERVHVAMTDPELFDVLGVQPVLGRAYTAADARGTFMNLNWTVPVLIGHELWLRSFGADSDVVGRIVRINDRPREVIGILPPSLEFPNRDIQVWMLFIPEASSATVGRLDTRAVGRLRPGVTPDQAEAELRTILPAVAGRYRDATPQRLAELGLRPRVQRLRDVVVGDAARLLWAVFGGMAVLLLVASANITNLILVRAEHRARESAVRRALGARSVDVARLLLLESAVLIAIGATLGVILAAGVLRLVVDGALVPLPRLHEVQLDGQSILFAASLALLLTVIVGVIGGWHQHRRASLGRLLRAGGSAARMGPGAQYVRRGLIVSQIALALTLLVCAALMLRSVQYITSIPRGFNPTALLTVEIGLPYAKAAQHRAVYTGLLDRLRVIPGVGDAAAVSDLPLTGTWRHAYPVQGSSVAGPVSESEAPVALAFFTPGYFKAMGTPIVAGTTITDSTAAQSRPVLVSASLARRLLREGSGVGGTVRRGESAGEFDPAQPDWTVVGVVADVRQRRLADPPAEVVYVPLLDPPVEPWIAPTEMTIVLRTTVPPGTLVGSVRSAMAAYDPSLSIARIRTMDAIVTSSAAATTLLTWLLLAAAAAALLLGSVGIWGVVAYAVRQRTAEIGVRVALGAPRRSVLSLIVGEALAVVLVGTAVGFALSVAATRAMQALLVGVSPADPIALIAAATLLVGVGCLAAYLPARAATRVNPVIALQNG